MRWAVKAPDPHPNAWRKRTVRRFAFLPEYGYARDGYGGHSWNTIARYSADPLWSEWSEPAAPSPSTTGDLTNG